MTEEKESKNEDKLIEWITNTGIFAPILTALILTIAMLTGYWCAYWYADVWNWFVISYFKLEPITTWQMFGLLITANLLAKVRRAGKSPPVINIFMTKLIEAPLIWCLCWVINTYFY